MFFFVLGLFWGSFLNNIALRLEKEEDFLFTRSKCPFCGKKLEWFELIPVLSFILQKGKCRSCQSKISLRYPLVEIATGLWVYFLAVSLKTTLHPLSLVEFVFYFLFLSILFVLALFDLKTFLVDEKFVFLGYFLGLLFILFKNFLNLPYRDFSYLLNYFVILGKWEPLFSALFLGTLFFLIFLATKGRGLGFGDVEVAFLAGLFFKLGDALLITCLASLFGSLYGLYLLLKFRKFKQPLPFVPFIFLGVITTISFGKYLTEFYFKFVL